MRERWFGATGRRVPDVAAALALGLQAGRAADALDLGLRLPRLARLAGRADLDDGRDAVLDGVEDVSRLEEAHAQGVPVVVRAATAEAVGAALERPEVACVLVPPEQRELRELDFRQLKYG